MNIKLSNKAQIPVPLGDIKHHYALDAKIHGVNLIDINHYSEYVMKEGLKALLMNWFNTEKINLDVEASTINTDIHFNIFKLKSRDF